MAVDAFPCGSRSTSRTAEPLKASPAAKLTTEVVFPTPPFWLATAMTRPPSSPRVSRETGPGGAVGLASSVTTCSAPGRVSRETAGEELAPSPPGTGHPRPAGWLAAAWPMTTPDRLRWRRSPSPTRLRPSPADGRRHPGSSSCRLLIPRSVPRDRDSRTARGRRDRNDGCWVAQPSSPTVSNFSPRASGGQLRGTGGQLGRACGALECQQRAAGLKQRQRQREQPRQGGDGARQRDVESTAGQLFGSGLHHLDSIESQRGDALVQEGCSPPHRLDQHHV